VLLLAKQLQALHSLAVACVLHAQVLDDFVLAWSPKGRLEITEPVPVLEHRTGHLDQPGLVLLLELLLLLLQAEQHPQELQKDLHTEQHSINNLLEHIIPLGDMGYMKDAIGRPSALQVPLTICRHVLCCAPMIAVHRSAQCTAESSAQDNCSNADLMIQLEQQRQWALASPELEASQQQQAVQQQQQQMWLQGLAEQKQRGGQQAQHNVQDAVSA